MQELTFSTCTINEMIGFMFDNKEHPSWEEIYLEYIDVSGIGITQEFDALLAIHNIQTRLNAIPRYVQVQVACWYNFKQLHPVATEKLARYGYKMPVSDPLDYLSKIELKEKRYLHDLKQKEKQLAKIRETRTEAPNSKKDRIDFIRMLNHLGTKYRIDREKTTVEELAIMVKDANDEATSEQMQKLAKGN